MKWQPYHAFLLALVFEYWVLRCPLWKSTISSYLIYLLAGGFQFQRLFFLTIRRDMKGLKCLLMILYTTYWNHFKKEPFADMWAYTLRKHGRSRVAIYFEDQIWTFGQLDDYSNKVANHLLQMGFKQGDKLFLLLNSSASYIGVWLGAIKIGVSTGLLNYNLKKESLAHCLKALDAKGIVVGNQMKDQFLEINGPNQFDADKVWYLDEAASTQKSAESNTTTSRGTWNQLIAAASSVAPPKLPKVTGREHVLYPYTSGTTGLPKAAIITTPRYIYMCSGTKYAFDIYKSDVLYIPLPLYHNMAVVCGAGQMLLHGTTLAIRSKFSASKFWDDCIRYNCTASIYIGEVCRYLLAQPPKPEDTMHRLRLAYGNGLRRETWIKFQERFKVPYIGELYGATEANSSMINCDHTVGAVGFIPFMMKNTYPIRLVKTDPVTEEIIRDAATGFCIECKANEIGQMIGLISNNNPSRFFDGYTDKGASQKKVLQDAFKKGDTWFVSGDLLYTDELGYLYFSDRLGDTFRWRGENVSTQEVESVFLKAFPSKNSVVYGVPVPGSEGKAGMAAIEMDVENTSPEDEQQMIVRIQNFVKSNLPSYSQPLFLRLSKTIEMTSTFKLLKRDLINASYKPINNDHIYWRNPQSGNYERLLQETMEKIDAGLMRL